MFIHEYYIYKIFTHIHLPVPCSPMCEHVCAHAHMLMHMRDVRAEYVTVDSLHLPWRCCKSNTDYQVWPQTP